MVRVFKDITDYKKSKLSLQIGDKFTIMEWLGSKKQAIWIRAFNNRYPDYFRMQESEAGDTNV